MKNYDVVIIGAGLAGLQCARILSRRGAKILLVDRKTDLAKGVHTTGIFVRKTLEDFDFPVGTLGKAIRNVTLYSPRLKAINLKSEKDEFRVGKMSVLYETFLRECLENGVEFAAGTRYVSARMNSQLQITDCKLQSESQSVFGNSKCRRRKAIFCPRNTRKSAKEKHLISFSLIFSRRFACFAGKSPIFQKSSQITDDELQNENESDCSNPKSEMNTENNFSKFFKKSEICNLKSEIGGTQTIVKLEKNGKPFEVQTKILIGADGANSRVAKDLKLDENKEWIVGYEEVFHAEKPSGEPRLHCFLDAELAPGYLAWIADDGEEIHIGVGGYAADFNPREALKLFKEKTQKVYDLKNAKLIETRGGRIPVGGVLRKIANEHGLLIGDAAGAVSPLTAGGLDPAVRLSKFAAEIVWERLRTDNPQVLLNYSGERFRARFVSRLWMRRIIRAFTNQNLLEFGFAFLRNRFGQKFARHVFFGRGSFPDVEVEKETRVFSAKVEI